MICLKIKEINGENEKYKHAPSEIILDHCKVLLRRLSDDFHSSWLLPTRRGRTSRRGGIEFI